MCDGCRVVMPDFGIPHERSSCPFLQSLYCSNCARKAGHTLENCPDRPSRRYTQPCYVEQLVPPSLLKQYGITTRTPLPPPRTPSPPKRLIEILDDNATISAYLAARGVKRRKGEKLRDALQRYGVEVQKRVIYISRLSRPCDAANEILQKIHTEEDAEEALAAVAETAETTEVAQAAEVAVTEVSNAPSAPRKARIKST